MRGIDVLLLSAIILQVLLTVAAGIAVRKVLKLHSTSLDGLDRRSEALGRALSNNLDNSQKGVEVLGTMLSDNLGTTRNGFEALGTMLSNNLGTTQNGFEALGTTLEQFRRHLESIQGEVGRLSNRMQLFEAGISDLKCRADVEAQQIARLREGITVTNFGLATLARFDWHLGIAGAMKDQPFTLRAQKFLYRRKTGSQPVDLLCSDGNRYVVKALRLDDPKSGRMLFNDYVIGTLGRLMKAPVPNIALISIAKDLIEANADSTEGMGHLFPGIAHGSQFCDGLGDRDNEFKYIEQNRSRFASILILHAWALYNDRHFLYETRHPFRVFSVDHGKDRKSVV